MFRPVLDPDFRARVLNPRGFFDVLGLVTVFDIAAALNMPAAKNELIPPRFASRFPIDALSLETLPAHDDEKPRPSFLFHWQGAYLTFPFLPHSTHANSDLPSPRIQAYI